MKPDWKDAPEWANYLAKNADGVWHWHENNPKIYGFSGLWDSSGRRERATNPGEGWDKALEERPK